MTQRERVLSLLRTYSLGVTTSQFLQQHIPRFSARLQELRDAGYVITTERVREGQYRFRLVSEAGPEPTSSASPLAAQAHSRSGPASDTRLFDSKPQGTTRSAITGDVMGDAA